MSNILVNNQLFFTNDLGLCVILVTLGFSLIKLDKAQPQKIRFYFKHTQELEKAVEAYWNNSIKTNPLRFFNNIKLVKNRMYSEF